MNLGYWIREVIRRGGWAFLIAIVVVFVFRNSVTTLLKILFNGGAFTPQRAISIWLSGTTGMLQGDASLSVIAIGLVAALGTAATYTWHNLVSKNFDEIIGLYISVLSVIPFIFSSSIPDPIPVWIVALIPVLIGVYFIRWQSK